MLWMSSADKQCLRPSQGIAAIRPKIRPIGLAPVRIGLWHRGFIGMQHRALAQQLGEVPQSGSRATPVRPILLPFELNRRWQHPKQLPLQNRQ